jgi:hypothetical protein
VPGCGTPASAAALLGTRAVARGDVASMSGGMTSLELVTVVQDCALLNATSRLGDPAGL